VRRPTLLVLAVLAAILAAPAAAHACRGASHPPSALSAARHAKAVRCLVNLERASRGIPKLRADRRLGRAARGYARLMARRDFFAHVSPAGSTLGSRVRRARFRGSVGEVLAWGQRGGGTPRALVNGWLRSPGHRAILLSPRFRRIGVGSSMGAPVGRLRGSVTVDAVLGRSR
jgi:uncharacterized protein YkwD